MMKTKWVERDDWSLNTPPLPLLGALRWARLEHALLNRASVKEAKEIITCWLSSSACHKLSKVRKGPTSGCQQKVDITS